MMQHIKQVLEARMHQRQVQGKHAARQKDKGQAATVISLKPVSQRLQTLKVQLTGHSIANTGKWQKVNAKRTGKRQRQRQTQGQGQRHLLVLLWPAEHRCQLCPG